tara:strand:+ start:3222 stop:3410 length:189 start_codon:yes stop_codon:yes gene_type:complete
LLLEKSVVLLAEVPLEKRAEICFPGRRNAGSGEKQAEIQALFALSRILDYNKIFTGSGQIYR